MGIANWSIGRQLILMWSASANLEISSGFDPDATPTCWPSFDPDTAFRSCGELEKLRPVSAASSQRCHLYPLAAICTHQRTVRAGWRVAVRNH
ncbi:uncharacterized protein B0H18DRAFT_1008936 [Fomitopsis serialis]|uniref:uncharacterized protein n=1 Tax=Fomitopsis serialis TaxID=139415 RepID=UPI0020075C34|nr:uncharacterized protein B0H18DRAFT_1008936 [Neoantrodia serialis]KAH9925550.1 hypothetical protein B0H18DRAFT_1008936 [Neoantrodia serialis]